MRMSASIKRSTGTGVLARDQNIEDSGQSWQRTKVRCAFVRAKCPNVNIPAIHNLPEHCTFNASFMRRSVISALLKDREERVQFMPASYSQYVANLARHCDRTPKWRRKACAPSVEHVACGRHESAVGGRSMGRGLSNHPSRRDDQSRGALNEESHLIVENANTG